MMKRPQFPTLKRGSSQVTDEINSTDLDREAIALAACYRLLLQKAKERRCRFAKVALPANDNQESEQLDAQDGNEHIDD